MRLLLIVVLLPLAGILGWWALNGTQAAGEQSQVTFPVERRSFKVTLQEKGELKAANSIEIKCEVEGRSTIIYLIREGTHVKQGDLLVELASEEIVDRVRSQQIEVTSARASLKSVQEQFEILVDQNKSNMSKAKLKLELAQLELKKYKDGEWPQQLDDAELRVQETQKIYERRKVNLAASELLEQKKYITRTEYETDEFDTYKAQIEHAKALRDLSILKDFTHVKDLQQRESDVEEAFKEFGRVIKEADAKENEQTSNLGARESELNLKDQRLAKLQEQKTKTKIYAPAEGMVVYGSSNNSRWGGDDDQIKEGAEVRERQTLMELPDTSKMKAVVRVHEAQTQNIREGQQAVVTVEGVDDRQFNGEITKIAVLADSQHRWMNPELKEYETEIMLAESDPRLKPGVTAKAEILVASLSSVVAVPVQSVYTKGNRRFVFVGDRDRAQPLEVELGLSGSEFVEIKSGLQPGSSVMLAVSDDLRRELPEAVGKEVFEQGPAQAIPVAAPGEASKARPSAESSQPKPEGAKPERKGRGPRRAGTSS